MTWFSVPNSTSLNPEKTTPKQPIIKALQWFWRFSNFYGEYNTLPPSQRNKYVAEQSQRVRDRQEVSGSR